MPAQLRAQPSDLGTARVRPQIFPKINCSNKRRLV